MSYLASDTAKFAELNSMAHASANVGGWMVQSAESEALYAVIADGSVYCRLAKRPNASFLRAGAKWTRVAAVPPAAEWIGGYPAPTAK